MAENIEVEIKRDWPLIQTMAWLTHDAAMNYIVDKRLVDTTSDTVFLGLLTAALMVMSETEKVREQIDLAPKFREITEQMSRALLVNQFPIKFTKA